MVKWATSRGLILLYILTGEDGFSLHQSLEGIKASIGDQTTLEANTTLLDGQKVTVDQMRTVCEAAPFLSEKRLVVIQGLLERFEPRSKPGRGRTGTSNHQNEYKELGEYISQIPESTILVLIDGKIASKNPLFGQLSGKAKVMTFPLLRHERLRQWIQKRVAGAGGSITAGAVELLTRFVGGNLWIMASEIDKLVLFSSGRDIEEEDVSRLVSYAREANVFAMVDAVLEFKAGAAEQQLGRLLQQGVAPTHLMAMLARQVRMIVRVREMRNQRKSRTEIQSRLGLTSDYALQRTLEQADRYSMARIKEVYHRLLETDLSIKTGKYDAEFAFTILIAELCQRRKLEII